MIAFSCFVGNSSQSWSNCSFSARICPRGAVLEFADAPGDGVVPVGRGLPGEGVQDLGEEGEDGPSVQGVVGHDLVEGAAFAVPAAVDPLPQVLVKSTAGQFDGLTVGFRDGTGDPVERDGTPFPVGPRGERPEAVVGEDDLLRLHPAGDEQGNGALRGGVERAGRGADHEEAVGLGDPAPVHLAVRAVAFGGPRTGEVDDVDVLTGRLPLVEFVGHTASGVVADGAPLPAEEGVARGGPADSGLSADDDVRLSLLGEPIAPPVKQFCELLEFGEVVSSGSNHRCVF
ncbi:hypothetical protein FOF52_02820 [Thermobifida alba]|uniref:Uncharacterized protein n=1 Tax=Thermobifida alba TaxID=53522 RepID=A0ABY4KYA2_THEAE|nr:hypothetical protein [Thermobifida alba]UPT20035.1 hypothetical protein FOF52_02820 [Thermobifida alba]